MLKYKRFSKGLFLAHPVIVETYCCTLIKNVQNCTCVIYCRTVIKCTGHDIYMDSNRMQANNGHFLQLHVFFGLVIIFSPILHN